MRLAKLAGILLMLKLDDAPSIGTPSIKTQWTDLETNAVSNEEAWFRRFHDRYHNEAVIFQLGVVDKTWADKLIFGLNYSHEYHRYRTPI